MTGGGYPDGIRRIVDAYARRPARGGHRATTQRWLPLINYENRQCGLLAAKALMKEGGVIACEAPRHPFPAHAPGDARRPDRDRAPARSAGAALGPLMRPGRRSARAGIERRPRPSRLPASAGAQEHARAHRARPGHAHRRRRVRARRPVARRSRAAGGVRRQPAGAARGDARAGRQRAGAVAPARRRDRAAAQRVAPARPRRAVLADPDAAAAASSSRRC